MATHSPSPHVTKTDSEADGHQYSSKTRCPWAISDLEKEYHDHEWGSPIHDDRKFLELLILEGAQAGLSWVTVLKKRDNYRAAFDDFDVQKIAQYSDSKQAELLQNSGIIRNRLKIKSAVDNAKAFIKVQEEYGTFDAYLWSFVNNTPVVNNWKSSSEIPASTNLSDEISKDLKHRGFSFVGTTIVYALLQSAGLVDDHLSTCFRKNNS